MLGAMAVLDESHVFLDRDPFSDRFCLGSTLTFEKRLLPPGDFELIFEEGIGFIFRHEDPAGEILPVADILNIAVFPRGGGEGQLEGDADPDYELRWRDASRQPIAIRALARRRALRTWSFKVPPTDLVASIACAIFARPRADGGQVFVSLQAFHSVFGLTQFKGKSSIWANHMWGSFEKLLESNWGVGAGHLLKSRAYNSKEQRDQDPERTLPFHALSLHAFLCLLFQWSTRHCNDGGFSNPQDARKTGAAFQGLLSLVPDMNICLFECPVVHPFPRLVGAGCKAILEVSGGALLRDSLTVAAAAGNDIAERWNRLLEPDDCGAEHEPYTLFVALQALGRKSHRIKQCPEAHHLATQILRAVALELDKTIAGAQVADGDISGRFQVSPAQGTSEEAMLHEAITAHLAAGRQAAKESWEIVRGLSFCNDDSNVRSLELSNTVIVLPTNVACWAPTQAFLGNSR